jgi:hypothetical protein
MAESRPNAADLLAGVIDYLDRELLPTLEGRHRFHVRVAANALAVVKREIELGPGLAEAERARLAALLGQDGTLDNLNRALAERIRLGAIADESKLVEHLKHSIGEALSINNPKWRS